jgi:multimeric flavodoxin WrbA
VELALSAAKEAGAETELLAMSGKKIAPCHGCLACQDSGKCRIKDDMQDWLGIFEQAQAIIFGTPIFFFNLSGAAKVLMDSTCAHRARLQKMHFSKSALSAAYVCKYAQPMAWILWDSPKI